MCVRFKDDLENMVDGIITPDRYQYQILVLSLPRDGIYRYTGSCGLLTDTETHVCNATTSLLAVYLLTLCLSTVRVI